MKFTADPYTHRPYDQQGWTWTINLWSKGNGRCISSVVPPRWREPYGTKKSAQAAALRLCARMGWEVVK